MSDVDLLTELAKHRNWELDYGETEDDGIRSVLGWRVHSVNGGINDREWTLIGTGDTPQAALLAALKGNQ